MHNIDKEELDQYNPEEMELIQELSEEFDDLDRVYNKIINKEASFKIHEFCDNYKLNDRLKEKEFNEYFSQPENIHVFYEENIITKAFFKSIDDRILDKNNGVYVISGEPNLGKSELGISLAKYILKRFKILRGIDEKLYYGFSDSDMDKLIPKLKIGSVLIRDESPKGSGADSQTIKDAFNNTLQIIRKHMNFFILISPKPVDADVITYHLKMAGKNKKTRKLRFVVYIKPYDDEQPLKAIGRAFIKLHDDDELRKEYEKQKDQNIDLHKATSGIHSNLIDTKEIERKALLIANYCTEKGYKFKNEIDLAILKLNDYYKKIKQYENLITGTPSFMKNVVQRAYEMINPHKFGDDFFFNDDLSPEVSRSDHDLEEIESSSITLVNYVEEYYHEKLPVEMKIANEFINQLSIIEVLKKWISGYSIKNITDAHAELHQGKVNNIIKLFQTGKRKYKEFKSEIPVEMTIEKAFLHYCIKKYELILIDEINGVYLTKNGILGHVLLLNQNRKEIELSKLNFYLFNKRDKLLKEGLKDLIDLEDMIEKDPEFTITKKGFDKFTEQDYNLARQQEFFLIYRNVKWGEVDYLAKISMKIPLKLIISRDKSRIITMRDVK